MVLRKVIMQDLDQIIALENIGFSPEEAATPEAFENCTNSRNFYCS